MHIHRLSGIHIHRYLGYKPLSEVWKRDGVELKNLVYIYIDTSAIIPLVKCGNEMMWS